MIRGKPLYGLASAGTETKRGAQYCIDLFSFLVSFSYCLLVRVHHPILIYQSSFVCRTVGLVPCIAWYHIISVVFGTYIKRVNPNCHSFSHKMFQKHVTEVGSRQRRSSSIPSLASTSHYYVRLSFLLACLFVLFCCV